MNVQTDRALERCVAQVPRRVRLRATLGGGEPANSPPYYNANVAQLVERIHGGVKKDSCPRYWKRYRESRITVNSQTWPRPWRHSRPND